jgi:hypothetical protein
MLRTRERDVEWLVGLDVLWAEDLIILGERELHTEKFLIESQTLLGNLEQLGGVNKLGERLSAIHAQWHSVVGIGINKLFKGTSNQSVDVRGDRGRGLEGHELGAVFLGSRVGFRDAISNDMPISRSGDRQGELSLDVGLIEIGHPTAAVVWLKVGVNIMLRV